MSLSCIFGNCSSYNVYQIQIKNIWQKIVKLQYINVCFVLFCKSFYFPQAEPGVEPLAPLGGLYFLHYREATHRKNTLLEGNTQDGLLEESVENKSFLKFNFKKLFFLYFVLGFTVEYIWISARYILVRLQTFIFYNLTFFSQIFSICLW